MNLKISSSTTPPPEVESDAPVDSFYNDLIDWAKERKQQFLRNRAKGISVSPNPDCTESPIKTETKTGLRPGTLHHLCHQELLDSVTFLSMLLIKS